MKKRILVTDVDGTLFDSMSLYLEAFKYTLRHMGFNMEYVKRFYYGSAGTTLINQYSILLKECDMQYSDIMVRCLVNDFYEFLSEHKSEVNIFFGVQEIIMTLGEQNLPIFVTSGATTAKIEKWFKKYGLPYTMLLGSDDIVKSKVHIKMFADCLEMPFDDFCQQAIFVGDGPNDMRIAKECGILAVGIPNTVSADDLLIAGANKIIQNFNEVQNFF